MNLHNIASAYVTSVNPWIVVSIQASNGYTTSPDGDRVPLYLPAYPVQAQMQAMTYNDLVQVSGLNINGEKRAIYINGTWMGVSRPDGKGGDLITLPDGTVWLTAMVLENWGFMDGWTKLAIVKQDGS